MPGYIPDLAPRAPVPDSDFLLSTHGLVKIYDERRVVNLIGVMGYYTTVSMLLNTDRYPLPAGVQPELK